MFFEGRYIKKNRTIFLLCRARLAYLMLVLGVLGACDSDTRENVQTDCPEVGDLTVTGQSSFGQAPFCQISGVLTVSATLPKSKEWFLGGELRVENGAGSDVVLTIEAGTSIRGSSGDFIHIARGAGLNAKGTAAEPIVMSANSLSEAQNAGGGLWGGLVIEDSLASNGQSVLEYVIITDAGETVAINSTIYSNNLTLIGDHSNTTIRFLQSHDSAQDGIRLEEADNDSSNPSVLRLDWVLVTGAGRDGISYRNFSGLLKDSLIIHRSGVFTETTATTAVGGRAGLFASGTASAPLITNLTLVGRDNDSDFSAGREIGIIFDDVNTQAVEGRVRVANVLIANFRHGCYQVSEDADLSNISLEALGNAPENNFFDGVHCVNENAGDAADGVVHIDGEDLPAALVSIGNGSGISEYSAATAINFRGESVVENFTQEWFLEDIASITNDALGGGVPLKTYRDGDTDNSGAATVTDAGFQPFLNSISDSLFTGLSNSGSSVSFQDFDLTHVGAIRSATSTQFNDWILQDNGVTPSVTGFNP